MEEAEWEERLCHKKGIRGRKACSIVFAGLSEAAVAWQLGVVMPVASCNASKLGNGLGDLFKEPFRGGGGAADAHGGKAGEPLRENL